MTGWVRVRALRRGTANEDTTLSTLLYDHPRGFLTAWLVAGIGWFHPLLGKCVDSTDSLTDRWDERDLPLAQPRRESNPSPHTVPRPVLLLVNLAKVGGKSTPVVLHGPCKLLLIRGTLWQRARVQSLEFISAPRRRSLRRWWAVAAAVVAHTRRQIARRGNPRSKQKRAIRRPPLRT